MEPSANKHSFLYMYQLPTISDRPKNLSVIRNFSPNEEILVPDKHRGKVMDDSDSHIYYYIEYRPTRKYMYSCNPVLYVS